MDIQAIKSKGKEAFKANYWRCVLVAFVLSLLTTGTTAATGTNSSQGSADQEIAGMVEALSPDELMALGGILLGTTMVVFVVSFLLKIFLFNPLQVGGYRFFRKNLREEGVTVGVMGEGFGGYGHTFGTLFLRDLFLVLWTLLLFIPGLIKSYSYMLVPYLLKDEPNLSAMETIQRSKELMNGHKWEAFMLDLSFIGWFILGMITLGLVNVFWTDPYHQNAKAEFYLELIGK